jgi:hypothetical protein
VTEAFERQVLQELYDRIPGSTCYRLRCVDVDPAGNTYDVVETDWHKLIRPTLEARGVKLRNEDTVIL